MPFHNGDHAVHAGNSDLFLFSARPMNFNFVDFRGRPKSEMKAWVGARSVAAAANDVGTLAKTAGSHKDLRADSIMGTFRSTNQLKGNPMIGVFYHVPKQGRWRIHVVQHNINVAVVEEIPKRRATCWNHVGQSASCCGRNFLKLGAVEIAK